MITLKGIPVSPGIAFGEALVIDDEGFRIRQSFIQNKDVKEEVKRYEDAFEQAKQELSVNVNSVTKELGDYYGLIFQAHLAILDDSTLREEILRVAKRLSTELGPGASVKESSQKSKL